MAKHRLQSLEIMRACCALTVFVSHLYSKMDGVPQYAVLQMLTNYATEAVIGFFVLSGCVIAMQTYSSTAEYLKARIIRIVPIYYVALALTVTLMLVCGVGVDLQQLLGNALFLQTISADLYAPLSFDLPTWSLSHEMFYYIAFAVVLKVPKLLLPFFFMSFGIGVSLYFLPEQTGIVGWFLLISNFFCFWIIGVLVIRLHARGMTTSIPTGFYVFVTSLCLARAPFSSSHYDFGRLFFVAIGFGFLIWALASDEREAADPGKPSTILSLDILPRLAISACTLALLWILSPSLLATKIALTAIILLVTIAPNQLVRCATALLRPIVPALLYVGGLSYALYIVHYPLLMTVNSLRPFPALVNVLVVAVLSFGTAHVLEYLFQPWIAARLRAKRA